MFEIEYTDDALADLAYFRKFEQVQITQQVEAQLSHEPTASTRKRKRLRPNQTATWQLRIGSFRVFYNVEETIRIVAVVNIAEKRGNVLYFQGRRKDL